MKLRKTLQTGETGPRGLSMRGLAAGRGARLAVALLLLWASGRSFGVEGTESDKEEPAEPPHFELHILDVSYGHAAIIDFGDKEILIGSGDEDTLYNYISATEMIGGPIELAVVTNANQGSFEGLSRIMGLTGEEKRPWNVLEVWDPGYEGRGSDLYSDFLNELHQVPGLKLLRPLRKTHKPAVDSGEVEPFTLENLPGVEFTLLHADNTPEGWAGLYMNKLYNSSIVLKIKILGVRMLFPGDVWGRGYGGEEPQYVERELLDLEKKHPGALKADILLAPNNGSDSSSSQPFIDAVNPKIVAFSGPPEDAVTKRYQHRGREILTTGLHPEPELDDIVFTIDGRHPIEWGWGYERICKDGKARWEGAFKDGSPLTESKLEELFEKNWHRWLVSMDSFRPGMAVKAPEAVTELRGADLSGHTTFLSWREWEWRGLDLAGAKLRGAYLGRPDLRGANLENADLSYAYMPGAILVGAKMAGVIAAHAYFGGAADFSGANLTKCNLSWAFMPEVNLSGSDLTDANLSEANLRGAKFSGSDLRDADLSGANLRGAKFSGTKLKVKSLEKADLRDAVFEPAPGQLPEMTQFVLAKYLKTLEFRNSPHALVELRAEFIKGGLRQQERELTYAIERGKRQQRRFLEATLKYVLFEITCKYGLLPWRALWILVFLMVLFCVPYALALRFSKRSGVWTARPKDGVGEPGSDEVRTQVSARGLRCVLVAVYFSLLSATNVGWRDINIGAWIARLQPREYRLYGAGWVRTVSAAQSLTSVYLFALWLLCYFGRPFL